MQQPKEESVNNVCPRFAYLKQLQYDSYSQGFKHGYFTGAALTAVLTIAFQKLYEKYRP